MRIFGVITIKWLNFGVTVSYIFNIMVKNIITAFIINNNCRFVTVSSSVGYFK